MLKVGYYIRTKYGIIAKITDIIEDLSIDCDIDVFYEGDLKDTNPMMEIPYYLKDEYIIKSSPKIKKLIEVGDYVNGYRVDDIKNGQLKTISYYDGYICHLCTDNEIESIVTKEQFESIQYKVGEK